MERSKVRFYFKNWKKRVELGAVFRPPGATAICLLQYRFIWQFDPGDRIKYTWIFVNESRK